MIIITGELIGMTIESFPAQAGWREVWCGAGAQLHGGQKTIVERLDLGDWVHCDINENSLGHRHQAVINY